MPTKPERNWQSMFGIVMAIMSIGMPPEVTDERAFRDWAAKIGPILRQLANLTQNTTDNDLAAFFVEAVATDNTWSPIYAVISTIFVSPETDDEILVKLLQSTPEAELASYAILESEMAVATSAEPDGVQLDPQEGLNAYIFLGTPGAESTDPSCDEEDCPHTETKPSISPLMVIAAIRLLVELIRSWKQ